MAYLLFGERLDAVAIHWHDRLRRGGIPGQ